MGNSPMTSHDALTTWSLKVTWQIKSLIFSVRQVLWSAQFESSYLSRGKLVYNFTWLSDHLDTWGHVRNGKRDISFCTTSATTKVAEMVTYNEWNLTHNDTRPSYHVVTWDSVTNRKLNISSSTKPMTTKYGKLVTYGVTCLSDHMIKCVHLTN